MKDYIVYGVCHGTVAHDRVVEMIEGNVALNGKSFVNRQNCGGGRILFWSDRNEHLWSDTKRIFPPEKIKDCSEATVLICCYPVKQVVESLRSIGCHNDFVVFPFFSYYFGILRNSYDYGKWQGWMLEKSEEVYSFYETQDADTDRILTELIRQRSLPNPKFVPLENAIDIVGTKYFHDEELYPQGDITLIDCGAYDGDSILTVESRFGERLKKIYAVEPDAENIKALEKNLAQRNLLERTSICNCGASDREDTLFFNSQGSMTSGFGSEGDCQVKVDKIDNMVSEVAGRPCIKMDIEGFEAEALRGAAELIRKHAPFMEICVYHKPEDILTIPQTIKEINPNYKFYLRGGFHTTCLAVPV